MDKQVYIVRVMSHLKNDKNYEDTNSFCIFSAELIAYFRQASQEHTASMPHYLMLIKMLSSFSQPSRGQKLNVSPAYPQHQILLSKPKSSCSHLWNFKSWWMHFKMVFFENYFSISRHCWLHFFLALTAWDEGEKIPRSGCITDSFRVCVCVCVSSH